MPQPISLAIGFICLGVALPRAASAQAEELSPAPESRPATPTKAATASVALPSYRSGFLALPYVGVDIPVGAGSEGYALCVRVGSLLGWHVTPRFSINGEVSWDIMDHGTDPNIWSPSEHDVDLTLSPLLHFRSGEIVIGPKAGWFGNTRSTGGLTANGQGIVFGLNAGWFFPLRKVVIGGLLNATFRHFTTFDCQGSDSLTLETCGYHRDQTEAFGFSGAMIF
jgi:hypothetical protein